MASKKQKWIVGFIVIALVILVWVLWPEKPAMDEAFEAGLTKEAFAQPADEADAFYGMDGGGQFTQEEILGRNTWMAWAGGNEAFWDWLANNSFGTLDLLKTVSSYPCSPEQEQRAREYEAKLQAGSTEEGYGRGAYGKGGHATPPGTADAYDSNYGGPAKQRYGGSTAAGSYGAYPGACAQTMYPAGGQAPFRYYSRDTRFCYQGLMNQPGFAKPTAPDEYGLCLDRRTATEPDPLDEKIYGRPSGVLGLRLFPNPNFDDKAKQKWTAAMQRDGFYTDPQFFSDRELVRPYRVAMACSFCHVSPHPLNPPADPENPQLANLSGTIGAQYFWFGRIFAPNVTPDNFVWHLLGAQRPGAVDTSFIPADNLVNPRALNAIFHVKERLDNGTRLALETSGGGALNLPEVKTHKDTDYTFGVPHILWDGADSVGIDAALTRVYINIGEYHQEWIRHINPIVGLGKQSPITVEAAQKYSTFWNATQDRALKMAAYLIRAGYAMPLATVPGGAEHLTTDAAVLDRGKVVFAETCARCHSSKLPPQPQPAGGGTRLGEKGCIGENYLDCWDDFWQWTETPAFKSQMTQIVRAPDFLNNNYLSSDARIPVTLLKTEICSSMASNAVEGHVWNDFASESYKSLPSVGPVELFNPVGQESFTWKDTPGGGRGYQRVPSLVSVWATAPYLHNNEIGMFTGDPSVKGRLDAFNDAIQKLLSPGTRGHYVHRTGWSTDLLVQTSALPTFESLAARLLGLVDDGTIRVGPIPKGTPINLIGNINAGKNDPQVGLWTMLRTLKKLAKGLKDVQGQSEEAATARLTELVPDLLKLSACPDFEVDRGHEFGAELSAADKAALIEFLKTL
jgi:hypothetical protein